MLLAVILRAPQIYDLREAGLGVPRGCTTFREGRRDVGGPRDASLAWRLPGGYGDK